MWGGKRIRHYNCDDDHDDEDHDDEGGEEDEDEDEDGNDDGDDDGDDDGGGRPIPRPGSGLCASLRSRNAHGHFARAILCGNLQGKCRARMRTPRLNTGP